MTEPVTIEEMMRRVVHPCDAWARGANQENWHVAVEVMKAGNVLCGPAPRLGKSSLGVTMFLEQVGAEGLHVYVTDIGQAFVGLKNNFSAAMLCRQEQERRLARAVDTFSWFGTMRKA